MFNSFLIAAEGMPQFNSKTFSSQLFWLILSFSILYLLVSFVLLPRIRENIRLRKNKISNDIERAEKIKNEIEKMTLMYNNKIEDAKNKAKNMVKKSLIKSANEYNDQLEIVKKQIDKKRTEAEEKIKSYRNDIEKTILTSAISISSVILSRLNYKQMSQEDLEVLIKKTNPGKSL